MKRSILRGHVSPAFSRKLRGIGSRRHDASQKRLWKINVLPARAFVRSFAFSFLPFSLRFFFVHEKENISFFSITSFDFEKRIERTNISFSFFLFFTNGKESYIIFVDTSLYESFDFEKRGRNGLTNIYRLIVIIIIIIIQRRDDSTPMIEEGRGKGVYESLWKLGLEPR